MIGLGIVLWVVVTLIISEMMISSAKKTNPKVGKYSSSKTPF